MALMADLRHQLVSIGTSQCVVQTFPSASIQLGDQVVAQPRVLGQPYGALQRCLTTGSPGKAEHMGTVKRHPELTP